MFSASSRSIREAFKSLEAKGLIKVQQGRRAEVQTNSLERFVETLTSSMISTSAMDKKMIRDLMQVRTTIEVSASRSFPRSEPNPHRPFPQPGMHPNGADPPFLENSKDEEALAEFKDVELEFHATLIKSNDNAILTHIYDYLAPQLYSDGTPYRDVQGTAEEGKANTATSLMPLKTVRPTWRSLSLS